MSCSICLALTTASTLLASWMVQAAWKKTTGIYPITYGCIYPQTISRQHRYRNQRYISNLHQRYITYLHIPPYTEILWSKISPKRQISHIYLIRQPHHLCPVCLKKLHLLVGLSKESRWEFWKLINNLLVKLILMATLKKQSVCKDNVKIASSNVCDLFFLWTPDFRRSFEETVPVLLI